MAIVFANKKRNTRHMKTKMSGKLFDKWFLFAEEKKQKVSITGQFFSIARDA